MQQNRLTVLGPPRLVTAFARRKLKDARYFDWLETTRGRYSCQFESDNDPLLDLVGHSRRRLRLIFLLEYEKSRIMGLAKLQGGRLTRYEINY